MQLDGARTVVLVEGASDQIAIETLGWRTGRHLATHGGVVLAMGGATNIGHFLEILGPRRDTLRLTGLCDAGEVPAFQRALGNAGFSAGPTRDEMTALGFHVCVDDLEDELIRAVGATRVEEVIEAEGELRSFRTFQQQPAQRGWSSQRLLRRFLGTRSGRKARYARALVWALDLSRVPAPLDLLLTDVCRE
jgi:hypothetical protein